MTTARRVSLSLLVCGLLLCCAGAAAKERERLYPKKVSGGLAEAVRLVRDPRRDKAACRQPSLPPRYYLRVSARKDVLAGKKIKDDAHLGGKPFVFLTTPEDVCGLSLLDIYEQIGYEAEYILGCRHNPKCERDMVAVVFRYPADVSASPVRDGALPADWGKKVYDSTWDNIFSLFARLAAEADILPDKAGEFAPAKTFFRSPAERDFVLGLPRERRERLKAVPYATLRAFSGDDWQYRRLLETKLSAFEHFRGDGRTWDEVRDPEGRGAGLSEFVGPNMKLTALPEFAIIHLGQLLITDTYSAK